MNARTPVHSLTFVLVLLLGATGCATTVRVHPTFTERHATIRVIAAMPPAVTIYRVTFTGDQELMPELIPPAVSTIIETAEGALTQKGYTVPHLDPNDSALTQNAELQAAMFNVQQVFGKRLEEMARRRFPRNEVYSLGPEVNRFADMSRSDVLLFAHCEGLKKSGGEITKDIAKTLLIGIATLGHFVPMYPTSATALQLAMVDGDTGDILWYHSTLLNGTAQCDVANRRQLAAIVKGLLAPFPRVATVAASSVARSHASRAQSLAIPAGTTAMPAR